MQFILKSILLCGTVVCIAHSPALSGQEAPENQTKPPNLTLKTYVPPRPDRAANVQATKAQVAQTGASGTLPLWLFNIEASRDDNDYTGVMVGQNPFSGGGSASIKTFIVPLVITTNTIGLSADPKTLIVSTGPGTTTFDPTAADKACLGKSNNVPLRLVKASPLFHPAIFDFGGTLVGTTQYIDAHQRGSFWQVVGPDGGGYHVLFDPVTTLKAVAINVPAKYGTTLPAADFPTCDPIAIIDIDWFDNYLTGTLLPALASQGVNPKTVPVFLLGNVFGSFKVTDLNQCCIAGYHSINGLPIQTYSVGDFDTTGILGAAFEDTSTLSHELAELVNDPFTDNLTPAWGGLGQDVGSCQNNLEVGDPLSNTTAPPIVMPNGFTYHLQELAFFSWFFGSPSIGIHGWFSNNGTFLSDAGPVCVSSSASTSP